MLFSLIRSGESIYTVIACVFSSIAVIFLTLPIHEYAHGLVATKLGDPTPRYQGRLTLNPFAHIDYMGALCIILFGFGWARPVQVNARYFRNPKSGMALTAVAGPISNIIVAIIAMLLYRTVQLIFGVSVLVTLILTFCYYVASINVYLAVFNLIPIPPLDGSRVLFAFLPDKYYFGFMRYERYITIAVFALLWTGVLSTPLYYLSDIVMKFVYWISSLPFIFIK